VSECDREASTMRRPWPTRAVEPAGGGGWIVAIRTVTDYVSSIINRMLFKIEENCVLCALRTELLHITYVKFSRDRFQDSVPKTDPSCLQTEIV
jgi:hypothetical protein